jgi:hypothetical protein
MAIIQEIGFYQFEQAFKNADRMDNFSYPGLRVLFNSLEEYSDSTGENVELDVIALCCDYREETAVDIAEDYSIDLSDADSDLEGEELEQAKADIVREYLSEKTYLCGEYENDAGDVVFVFQCF